MESRGTRIAEASFPALDGSSKDPCYLRIAAFPDVCVAHLQKQGFTATDDLWK